jgi:hypothetical protein
VAQQGFVGARGEGFGRHAELNHAGVVGGAADFLDEPFEEGAQVEGRKFAGDLARIDAREQQHFLHQPGHALGRGANVGEQFGALGRLQAISRRSKTSALPGSSMRIVSMPGL